MRLVPREIGRLSPAESDDGDRLKNRRHSLFA
jgi:hypothetical protein